MSLVLFAVLGLAAGTVTAAVVIAVVAAAQSLDDTTVWFGLDDTDPGPDQGPAPDTWRRRRDLEAEAADQRERHQLEADEAPKTTNHQSQKGSK